MLVANQQKFQIRSVYATVFGDSGRKVLASSLLTAINMCSSTKTVSDKRSLERQVTKQYTQGTVSTARFVGSNNVLLPPIIVQCAEYRRVYYSNLFALHV